LAIIEQGLTRQGQERWPVTKGHAFGRIGPSVRTMHPIFRAVVMRQAYPTNGWKAKKSADRSGKAASATVKSRIGRIVLISTVCKRLPAFCAFGGRLRSAPMSPY